MANCPAIRPTLTTGRAAPYIRTTAICSKMRNISRILLAPKSSKLSAQSPPCNKKALPLATSPSDFFSRMDSSAKTKGGYLCSFRSTHFNTAASSYSGKCAAGFERQLSGSHSSIVIPREPYKTFKSFINFIGRLDQRYFPVVPKGRGFARRFPFPASAVPDALDPSTLWRLREKLRTAASCRTL